MRDSYRYLAESIRMHPDQEALLTMLQDAGLEASPLSYNPRRRHRGRATAAIVIEIRYDCKSVIEFGY